MAGNFDTTKFDQRGSFDTAPAMFDTTMEKITKTLGKKKIAELKAKALQDEIDKKGAELIKEGYTKQTNGSYVKEVIRDHYKDIYTVVIDKNGNITSTTIKDQKILPSNWNDILKEQEDVAKVIEDYYKYSQYIDWDTFWSTYNRQVGELIEEIDKEDTPRDWVTIPKFNVSWNQDEGVGGTSYLEVEQLTPAQIDSWINLMETKQQSYVPTLLEINENIKAPQSRGALTKRVYREGDTRSLDATTGEKILFDKKGNKYLEAQIPKNLKIRTSTVKDKTVNLFLQYFNQPKTAQQQLSFQKKEIKNELLQEAKKVIKTEKNPYKAQFIIGKNLINKINTFRQETEQLRKQANYDRKYVYTDDTGKRIDTHQLSQAQINATKAYADEHARNMVKAFGKLTFALATNKPVQASVAYTKYKRQLQQFNKEAERYVKSQRGPLKRAMWSVLSTYAVPHRAVLDALSGAAFGAATKAGGKITTLAYKKLGTTAGRISKYGGKLGLGIMGGMYGVHAYKHIKNSPSRLGAGASTRLELGAFTSGAKMVGKIGHPTIKKQDIHYKRGTLNEFVEAKTITTGDIPKFKHIKDLPVETLRWTENKGLLGKRHHTVVEGEFGTIHSIADSKGTLLSKRFFKKGKIKGRDVINKRSVKRTPHEKITDQLIAVQREGAIATSRSTQTDTGAKLEQQATQFLDQRIGAQLPNNVKLTGKIKGSETVQRVSEARHSKKYDAYDVSKTKIHNDPHPYVEGTVTKKGVDFQGGNQGHKKVEIEIREGADKGLPKYDKKLKDIKNEFEVRFDKKGEPTLIEKIRTKTRVKEHSPLDSTFQKGSAYEGTITIKYPKETWNALYDLQLKSKKLLKNIKNKYNKEKGKFKAKLEPYGKAKNLHITTTYAVLQALQGAKTRLQISKIKAKAYKEGLLGLKEIPADIVKAGKATGKRTKKTINIIVKGTKKLGKQAKETNKKVIENLLQHEQTKQIIEEKNIEAIQNSLTNLVNKRHLVKKIPDKIKYTLPRKMRATGNKLMRKLGKYSSQVEWARTSLNRARKEKLTKLRLQRASTNKVKRAIKDSKAGRTGKIEGITVTVDKGASRKWKEADRKLYKEEMQKLRELYERGEEVPLGNTGMYIQKKLSPKKEAYWKEVDRLKAEQKKVREQRVQEVRQENRKANAKWGRQQAIEYKKEMSAWEKHMNERVKNLPSFKETKTKELPLWKQRRAERIKAERREKIWEKNPHLHPDNILYKQVLKEARLNIKNKNKELKRLLRITPEHLQLVEQKYKIADKIMPGLKTKYKNRDYTIEMLQKKHNELMKSRNPQNKEIIKRFKEQRAKTKKDNIKLLELNPATARRISNEIGMRNIQRAVKKQERIAELKADNTLRTKEGLVIELVKNKKEPTRADFLKKAARKRIRRIEKQKEKNKLLRLEKEKADAWLKTHTDTPRKDNSKKWITPEEYMATLDAKGKIDYGINYENRGWAGLFIPKQKGQPKPKILIDKRPLKEGQLIEELTKTPKLQKMYHDMIEKTMAHELTHYKQSKRLPKWVMDWQAKNLPYKLQPIEIQARLMSKIRPKTGFRNPDKKINFNVKRKITKAKENIKNKTEEVKQLLLEHKEAKASVNKKPKPYEPRKQRINREYSITLPEKELSASEQAKTKEYLAKIAKKIKDKNTQKPLEMPKKKIKPYTKKQLAYAEKYQPSINELKAQMKKNKEQNTIYEQEQYYNPESPLQQTKKTQQIEKEIIEINNIKNLLSSKNKPLKISLPEGLVNNKHITTTKTRGIVKEINKIDNEIKTLSKNKTRNLNRNKVNNLLENKNDLLNELRTYLKERLKEKIKEKTKNKVMLKTKLRTNLQNKLKITEKIAKITAKPKMGILTPKKLVKPILPKKKKKYKKNKKNTKGTTLYRVLDPWAFAGATSNYKVASSQTKDWGTYDSGGGIVMKRYKRV